MEKRSLKFDDVLGKLLPYVEERAKQFGVWMDTGSADVYTRYTYTGAELLQEEANRGDSFWNDGEVVPDALYQKYEYNFYGTGTQEAVHDMANIINAEAFHGIQYDSSMDYCWPDVYAEDNDPIYAVDEEEETTGTITVSIMFLALMED